MQKVLQALAFAADAHRNQRRKDAQGTPYINHPIALLHILGVEAGITDPDVLAAAVLHDYLEDCCGGQQVNLAEGREELRCRFGDAVLAYVDAVTDDKTLPKQERKALQVAKAKAAPQGARLVKLADKIANLRDLVAAPPQDWPPDRKLEYFEWAAQVVAGLKGTHPGLEALFEEAYRQRALP